VRILPQKWSFTVRIDMENVTPVRKSFLTDPMTFAHLLQQRPLLMINALWDEFIPKEATLDFGKRVISTVSYGILLRIPPSGYGIRLSSGKSLVLSSQHLDCNGSSRHPMSLRHRKITVLLQCRVSQGPRTACKHAQEPQAWSIPASPGTSRFPVG